MTSYAVRTRAHDEQVSRGNLEPLSTPKALASHRRFDGRHVDLLHRHHRLKGVFGRFATRRQSFGQYTRRNLPRDAPTGTPLSATVGRRASAAALTRAMRHDASCSKKIGPSDAAGVLLVGAAFTPDGRYYAYSCFNGLSQLYLVDGLR